MRRASRTAFTASSGRPRRGGRGRLIAWATGDCPASLLGEVDAVADNDTRYPQPELSERLAHAGVLPMFGFPTRVRFLYADRPRRLPPTDVVDRDLDIAISQFAPGSETVREGGPDERRRRDIRQQQGTRRERDGRGIRFAAGFCRRCGTVDIATGEIEGVSGVAAAVCPTCDADEGSGRTVHARAALYSFAELLRKAACDALDVETSELNVNVRSVRLPEGQVVGEVFLADSLANGAGYCTHLADPARLKSHLLNPLTDPSHAFYRRLVAPAHADFDAPGRCDGACYDCLPSWENAELHPRIGG